MEAAFTIGLILNLISMIACPIIAGNKGRSVAGGDSGQEIMTKKLFKMPNIIVKD